MKKKRVLLVPLNWGLGHATRLLPVISNYIRNGDTVFVGGSPSHLSIILEEFSEVNTVTIPYARIRFNGSRNQLLSLMLQIPFFFIQIVREHLSLKKIIKQHKINFIVSDNCYGLWNKNVHSVFITHQLNIILPHRLIAFEKFINKVNRWFIEKYDECWIPDLEDHDSYAGKLSHGNSLHNQVSYIGILSRFSIADLTDQRKKHKKEILFLISGPENQRTLFEKLIRDQIKYIPEEYVYTVIRGLPGKKEDMLPGWHNHLSSKKLLPLIKSADIIICRSGYSTIMDLLALKKTAVLVPTPGQPEQEYLAEYLSSKNLFCTMKQDEFTIRSVLEKTGN
ncbi:MAG: hypothetical protein JXB24_02470 [Bacteroidales bacterium]|nr:hypothetical protein [Bacteroidales bacterium]